MTQNSSDRRENMNQAVVIRCLGDQNRNEPFQDIEGQNGDSKRFSEDAEHIRRADIAAAVFTNIKSPQPTGQIAERCCANYISSNNGPTNLDNFRKRHLGGL